MLSCLRSIADAILGRVPGKPGRVDTSTRMWLDADFSDRGRPGSENRQRPAVDVDTLEELQRLTREVKEGLRSLARRHNWMLLSPGHCVRR